MAIPRCLRILLFCTLAFRAEAQFTQQGSKLVGGGVVGSALQGCGVALSSDGNTAIVGGATDNDGIGAAWVFTRSGDEWGQQGSKLVGGGAVGNAEQGYSVALSSDGNTAILGGAYDNHNDGAAWVFTRSGDVWSQQGDKLVGSGAVGPGQQGWSVALSSDGNTAIIGGPFDNNGAGAAWVFTRSGGLWSQQGSKLVGSGGVGYNNQGYFVALSSDGNTAAVGGPSDNNGAGAAWVFARSGGMWRQQGSKLVGSGAVGNAAQGPVALSSDGNIAIVGGPGDDNLVGAAWMFTRSGGMWRQQGSKLVGSGAVGNAEQGTVALASDGSTAIVGGAGDGDSVGAAWVFRRLDGAWIQQGDKLVGGGAVGDAAQGFRVALSSDGNTAIIGGWRDNNGAGAAWVFTRAIPHIVPPRWARDLADGRRGQ
jgi:uncharacterized protein YdbL (DUF1318 family)